MEEQNHENALQFSPLAINWTGNHDMYGLIGQHHANEPYMITPGSNNFHQVPQNHIIQWMHCQQTPQNYVQFLAESGYPEILNEMPCNFSVHAPSHGLLSSSQEQYVMPPGEGNSLTNYSNMEYQVSVQKEDWNKACSNDFRTYNGSDVIASTSEDRKRKSREKAYAAGRNRRWRISKSLDALQELLPHLKESGKKEALLDNVIEHMKYLQYQVKDLCRSRLGGGESTSNPFMFVEGHGHYLVNEQRLEKPLEEGFGKLLEVNPSAATELMHSKGLLVLPASSVEGLREQTEIMDMQGIMALDRILHEEFPSGMY